MVQPTEVREPLKFKPILQAKIWGGDGLYRVLRKGTDSDKDMGEAWELSDREGESTLVATGSFAGQSFKDLFARHARDILGQQYSLTQANFPLLYKFIYAREPLSVQVHPGEGSPLGAAKTECWYILEAPAGSELILGVAGDDDREKTLAALTTSDCKSVLNRVPVKVGDLFFIPAGTVHAITAGLLLYEVQQNSDTTFRLYDWDRVDATGKPRQLHIQESAQVLDLRRHDKHRISSLLLRYASHDEHVLVACPFFAIIKFSRCTDFVAVTTTPRFRVLTCVRGSFDLYWENGQSMPIWLGDTVLIPAACVKVKFRETETGSELLSSFIPNLKEEIIQPLRKAGFSEQAIRDLGGLDGLSAIEA